jgi:hypothetical protein
LAGEFIAQMLSARFGGFFTLRWTGDGGN